MLLTLEKTVRSKKMFLYKDFVPKIIQMYAS